MSSWKKLFHKDWDDEETPKAPDTVKTDGVSGAHASSSAGQSIPSLSAAAKTATSTAPVASYPSKTPPPDILELFDKMLAERNMPGPDFYEFLLSIAENGEMGMSESQLYNITFKTFSKMAGFDHAQALQVLQSSSQHYTATIVSNEEAFKSKLEGKRQEIKQRIADSEMEVNEIDEHIRKLQETKTQAIQRAEAAKQESLLLDEKAKGISDGVRHFRDAIIGETMKKIEKYIVNKQQQ